MTLPLAPCGFGTPYLSLPPLEIATMIPCTWGLSESYSTLSFPFPSFLLQFGQPIWGGGHTSPFVAGVSPLLAHKAHIFCRGCPEPLLVTRYVPGTPGTLPASEYYRPIYQSSPLDHFETPHRVYDLTRDFEQHSVTKSHNSYNTISSSNVKRADPTDLRTM